MTKLFFSLFVFSVSFSYSQSIGIGTTNPNATAALDVVSSNKGFLPPRMSFEQIVAISTPAPGLIIYNTTFNKPVYFDALNWRFFNDSIMKPKPGERLFGGIVFFVDPTGKHGLVAAPDDQSNNALWSNGSFVLTGAFSSSDGAANTTTIINLQGNTGTYAAKLCRDYRAGGYADWFLPAKDQLNILYSRRNIIPQFGFTGDGYWSSTEFDISKAYDQVFSQGEQLATTKDFPGNHVRAVRAF